MLIISNKRFFKIQKLIQTKLTKKDSKSITMKMKKFKFFKPNIILKTLQNNNSIINKTINKKIKKKKGNNWI